MDTHLDTHVAVAIDELGRKLGQHALSTDPGGYKALLHWVSELGVARCFGIEGTCSYGAGLSTFLMQQGHRVVEVDRPNRKARRLGKSDPQDAEQAARAVLAGTASSQPKTQNGPVEMVRALKVARSSAVKAATTASNSLKALVITAPSELRQQLRNLPNPRLMKTAAALRPGDCRCIISATKTALRSLGRRWLALQAEIKQLDYQLRRLTVTAAPELVSIFGVGPEVASTLMVTAGDNPQRLRSEASLAALCGVAPLPASSGKITRHRLSRCGDRQANAALHRVVIVRLQFHQPTRDYVARRSAEGKTKKEIIRCLKRYLVREVYPALRAMKTAPSALEAEI